MDAATDVSMDAAIDVSVDAATEVSMDAATEISMEAVGAEGDRRGLCGFFWVDNLFHLSSRRFWQELSIIANVALGWSPSRARMFELLGF